MKEQRDLWCCGAACWCSKVLLDYCWGLWNTGILPFRKFMFLWKSISSLFSSFLTYLPLTFVYKWWGGVERGRREHKNSSSVEFTICINYYFRSMNIIEGWFSSKPKITYKLQGACRRNLLLWTRLLWAWGYQLKEIVPFLNFFVSRTTNAIKMSHIMIFQEEN